MSTTVVAVTQEEIDALRRAVDRAEEAGENDVEIDALWDAVDQALDLLGLDR